MFDAIDVACLANVGADSEDLAYPYREQDLPGGKMPPQHGLAACLALDGYMGIRVPSFARGAGFGDMNAVFWVWGAEDGASVTVVDDDSRLPRDGRGWSGI